MEEIKEAWLLRIEVLIVPNSQKSTEETIKKIHITYHSHYKTSQREMGRQST